MSNVKYVKIMDHEWVITESCIEKDNKIWTVSYATRTKDKRQAEVRFQHKDVAQIEKLGGFSEVFKITTQSLIDTIREIDFFESIIGTAEPEIS